MGTLLELGDRPANDALVRDTLALPEQLGKALGLRLVIAIDEFQELLALSGSRGTIDPLPLMRSTWQRHERVGYVISGCAWIGAPFPAARAIALDLRSFHRALLKAEALTEH